MTAVIVTIDDAEAHALLNRLQDGLENLDPVLEAIGRKLESNIQQRFLLKEDPTGVAWAPLMESTKKAYAKKYPGGIPGSLLNRSNPGMLSSLNYQVDGNSVVIGFDVDYAQYHEFGTSKMVRRGMLMEDPVAGTLGYEDHQDIIDVINVYLQQLAE